MTKIDKAIEMLGMARRLLGQDEEMVTRFYPSTQEFDTKILNGETLCLRILHLIVFDVDDPDLTREQLAAQLRGRGVEILPQLPADEAKVIADLDRFLPYPGPARVAFQSAKRQLQESRQTYLAAKGLLADRVHNLGLPPLHE